MTTNGHDVAVLRELARQYAEIAGRAVQDERQGVWAGLNSLKPLRPTVLCTVGTWNHWAGKLFADDRMECADPFFRAYEKVLRVAIFHDSIGDDEIAEPWITVPAVRAGGWRQMYGLVEGNSGVTQDGGSWQFDPPIKDWADVEKLDPAPHRIDEEATALYAEKLSDAIGDILTVDVDRGPAWAGFAADLSTSLMGLRGLEQVMVDMYESPDELHRLCALMRDAVLAGQQQAEDAGDYGLTSQSIQAMPYVEELEPPRANVRPRRRKDLWCYCAAQEFELISPAMHDEFLFQYQLPIMESFGLVAYGCCEDLTKKIDMLRQAPNLRHIAVAPRADVAQCAEQIGTDYVLSWRPNPTDMVCGSFDEGRIRRIIRDGMEASKGCAVTLHLKDVETVQGEPDRLRRWVEITRSITDQYAA